MKTLALIVLAIAAMGLIAVQHQQIGQLRAENATLQQASAEADRLKADLAKSAGTEADAEDEISRLREENRDLLKLRNQVYQLREATAQFEQVRAENQRLQAVVQNAPKPNRKDALPRPVVILVQTLSNQGLRTPEAAVETIFWAEREGNAEALSNCIVPERRARIPNLYGGNLQQQNFDGIESIEIVARRNLDPNTIQLGLQIVMWDNHGPDRKTVVTLKLRDGEWKLDVDGLGF